VTDELIRLLVLDVDGVLTDGALWFDEQGQTLRRFHIRDGLGLALWRAAGRQAAILTSKRSQAVLARARMMGIEIIEQGQEDKMPGLDRILTAAGVSPNQAAYIGDDLLDLKVMRCVGYPIAVADAAPEARNTACWVTSQPGGHGAVREAVEHLLKAGNAWDQAQRALGLDVEGTHAKRP
jgi:YrbI family 3-deoxy-D-manno-octulosonate 8-phosphate phosphatase